MVLPGCGVEVDEWVAGKGVLARVSPEVRMPDWMTVFDGEAGAGLRTVRTGSVSRRAGLFMLTAGRLGGGSGVWTLGVTSSPACLCSGAAGLCSGGAGLC